MSRIAAQLAIADTNLHRSLSSETEQQVLASLKAANEQFAQIYPGDSLGHQPVHTFYGGAHLFKSDTISKLGKLALNVMHVNAANFAEFAKAVGLPGSKKLPVSKKQLEILRKKVEKEESLLESKNKSAWIANTVYNRVIKKLTREPIEDYRIDFEDGFGYRTDAEEDHEAMRTAQETASAMEQNLLPPFFGIRIKSFSEQSKRRAMRTLDIFLTIYLEKSGNRLPENFVVTLPKVVSPEQIKALVRLLIEFEQLHRLPDGSLKLEFMIESPQAIVGCKGESQLTDIVTAGEGRCVAAHFGPYDYTTGLNISSRFQTLDHPANDFARQAMQVALAGTGVRLSDGAVHLIPVGPHRAVSKALSIRQVKENREAVHGVWKNYFAQVQRSLMQGFYQSWDLHPGHLPVRYAAVYNFYLEGLEAASARMKSSIEKGNQASLSGQMFDDAASGQGLMNFFRRGIQCGALTEKEIHLTGLKAEDLRLGSFTAMIADRKNKP
ncbi:phosphoenolpyruvate kinase [bacterium]|nr:phosphoenolpyruvate kinase [bacterium]